MFEEKLNKLYTKIAQQVNDMIPDEWVNFYLNGELVNGEGGVFFFFYDTPKNRDYYIYSHDIPEIYNISEKAYDKENDKLFKLVRSLQQVFSDNDQEAWTSMVMIVNNERKLKVHFDYINWLESEFGPTDRINYFEFKYLKRQPRNDKENYF
ncbi:DUF600 family protein [Terrilactibacillus sp. S3-3]|nr:DUF600 family protein [Terrilactibacillus sp. S3-3]